MAGRRSNSDARATREAILRRAADIGSVEGLRGITIGRLATDLIADIIATQGTPPGWLHADGGAAMTSKPLSSLLADLDGRAYAVVRDSDDGSPGTWGWLSTVVSRARDEGLELTARAGREMGDAVDRGGLVARTDPDPDADPVPDEELP